MPHRVAVLAFPGISPFHLSVPLLVFDAAGELSAAELYEVRVVAAARGRLPSATGLDLFVDAGLGALSAADTIVVPSADIAVEPDERVLAALRAAHARGARLVGLCLGAFTIAAAGVLDGRAAATHWAWADELARRHPDVQVRSDVLWSDHGDVLTSAGVAAALDCCVHIVRTDHGADVARTLARELVLAPHREGNQAQYLRSPLAESRDSDPIDHVMSWARERLAAPISVDQWSRQANLSRRTFTRRFRQRTGQSCQSWLTAQRLEQARMLLETTDRSVDRIAADCGFGSVETLRHHFRQRLDTTPSTHRRAFRRA